MEPFHGIQAVSFDVGGTLIEPWPSVGYVYAQVASECGSSSFDPEILNARFTAAWRGRQDFNYTRAAWSEIVRRTFGGKAEEFGEASVLFQALYQRFSEPRAWKVYEDVLPALRRLRKSGLKLAVISNWDERLRPLLRSLELDVCFDAVEVSAESGFHKPSPEIFWRAARTLGVRPSGMLHCGDSESEDVRGARGAGLAAVLLKRSVEGADDQSITSLLELPELIH